ncbi:MAG: lycopene cyclase family protein [Planctomycetota bacterium]
MERVDDVIIGGGLAGLSLACALLDECVDRRVLVLEARTAYANDRTWCFWDVEPHAFASAVRRRWSRWSAQWQGATHVQGPGRHSYCEIAGEDFYRVARARIERDPRAELRLGTPVDRIDPTGSDWSVATPAGVVRARHVFDSRPTHQIAPELWQHFAGQRIETAEAAFEPGVATLMDFDRAQDGGIHFFYVLPESEHRALVEATWIGPTLFDDAVYTDAITRYLRDRYGIDHFRVHEEERGRIPMSVRRVDAHPAPGYYRIGTAGGQVKPSTGYAFVHVQRWSRAMARRLADSDRPSPPPARSRTASLLDSIFLACVRRHPERAPALFAALFRELDGDALARFLSERARPRDILRVMAALPKAEFLREAVRPVHWRQALAAG